MAASWYVVRTQPNKESTALVHLNNQGFETYLPRYKKKRRHARKTEIVLRPLFPSYMFVRLDLERQVWRSINGTVGVLGMVQFGTELACVPDDVVTAIRRLEDEQGVVHVPAQQFLPGEKVRILNGAMEDYIGVLAQAQDGERVTILLDMLGQEVRVRMPAEELARVS